MTELKVNDETQEFDEAVNSFQNDMNMWVDEYRDNIEKIEGFYNETL